MIRKNIRTNTAKASLRYNNNLPPLPNIMSRTSNQFHPIITKKKRTFLYSADQSKKYKLDSEKYRISINKKRIQISNLEKKCKMLKEKNKFNDEIIREMLCIKDNDADNKIVNQSNPPLNSNKSKENDQYIDRVKDYKKNKKILENVKNEYLIGKQENKKIKSEISVLNEDIKDIEKKVQEKKNEIIYLKNKIKISEKNKIQKNEILEKNKKENDKLNEEIIRYLEMQIGSNKEKLEDQNSKIEYNNKLIQILKNTLNDLESKIKK